MEWPAASRRTFLRTAGASAVTMRIPKAARGYTAAEMRGCRWHALPLYPGQGLAVRAFSAVLLTDALYRRAPKGVSSSGAGASSRGSRWPPTIR
jgi:hypothetical protein